ncbi:hypothetical protein MHJ85_08045 [Brevibacterium ravenspurgense]|uniref:hypothetical protein n=1 Tax=Brevibacterium ravenspurgense TaxID=479117 RepID=UPI001EF2719C|nr:hypothetical protein [Brevibacterium ravenspurgense]MCG7301202.1 hypothetical protein [Brevibacterium ravenspurgense]
MDNSVQLSAAEAPGFLWLLGEFPILWIGALIFIVVIALMMRSVIGLRKGTKPAGSARGFDLDGEVIGAHLRMEHSPFTDEPGSRMKAGLEIAVRDGGRTVVFTPPEDWMAGFHIKIQKAFGAGGAFIPGLDVPTGQTVSRRAEPPVPVKAKRTGPGTYDWYVI